MIKKLLLIFALILLPTSEAVFAQDSQLNLYPLQAIFTSKDHNNPRFSYLLDANRQDFTTIYVKEFLKYFPQSSLEISDKNKYRMFAAYVNIPRVSENYIDKEATVSVYIPMTMSINFVNMATGETLYSYPATHYTRYDTTKAILADKNRANATINKLYMDTYAGLIQDVLTNAQNNFKPFDIKTKVKDSYRNLYVLDKGSSSGISKGDLLSDMNDNQISVIYSALDYSIAKPLLGKPSFSSEFIKYANSSIMQLKKPKVLFVDDFGSEKLYNLFSSALGSNADFALLNVDKTFYDMQTALVSLNMGFKFSNTQNRTLPDYFLKLYITKPTYAQFQSPNTNLNYDKYSMMVCGAIFDKSGRVVYSQCVDDEIVDKAYMNMRFSDEARLEVLTKNAFAKLAKAFQEEVKFNQVSLKIDDIDGHFIMLNDPNGFLRYGNTVTVYKKISTERGGNQILLPTWEYKVLRVENGIAECKMMYPIVDNVDMPSKRDIVQITAVNKGSGNANMFNYAPDVVEISGNQVPIKEFSKIAFPALASTMKSPIAIPQSDIAEQVKLLNRGYGFKDTFSIPENNSDLKIKAVYKVNLVGQKFKGTVLEQTYDITVGVGTYKNDIAIKKSGAMQTVTITVPAQNNSEIIQLELLKNIYPLLQQLALKF